MGYTKNLLIDRMNSMSEEERDGYADMLYDQQRDAQAEAEWDDFLMHQNAGLIYTHDVDEPWLGTDEAWARYEVAAYERDNTD